MKLILNPPGRTERLFVTVPRGYSPGDTLRVRLPEERTETTQIPIQATPNRQPDPRQASRQTSFQESSRGQKASNLMKVRCPRKFCNVIMKTLVLIIVQQTLLPARTYRSRCLEKGA